MKRTQVLNLGKHFSIIDSPVPFYLVDNYGFRAYRPAGAWQFDNWKLLPEKFHKIYPVYTLSIEWDSGENDDIQPIFMDTDLDLGDGIAGVNGQPVNISAPVTIANNPLNVKCSDNNLVDSFFIIEDEEIILKSMYIKSGLLKIESGGSVTKSKVFDFTVSTSRSGGNLFWTLYGIWGSITDSSPLLAFSEENSLVSQVRISKGLVKYLK